MILKHNITNEAVIGVFLAGKTLSAGKVKNNRIVKSTSTTIDNLASEEDVLINLVDIIKEVFDEEIKGIGVGVPSLVDTENGIVYDVLHIPSWKEVHLKDILKDIFDVEIYINNDANCFVAGEKYFGKAINRKNVVGLVIGTGLGAGVIIENKLYSGVNCGVGEIGSLPYKEHTLEYYVSSKSFSDKYDMSFDNLLDRAKTGNEIALRIFENFGTEVAMALKTTLFAYDPEIIILGGPIAVSYQYFKDSMFKELKNFPYKRVLENIEIEVSSNIEIPVLGAAALLFDAKQKKFSLNK